MLGLLAVFAWFRWFLHILLNFCNLRKNSQSWFWNILVYLNVKHIKKSAWCNFFENHKKFRVGKIVENTFDITFELKDEWYSLKKKYWVSIMYNHKLKQPSRKNAIRIKRFCFFVLYTKNVHYYYVYFEIDAPCLFQSILAKFIIIRNFLKLS